MVRIGKYTTAPVVKASQFGREYPEQIYSNTAFKNDYPGGKGFWAFDIRGGTRQGGSLSLYWGHSCGLKLENWFSSVPLCYCEDGQIYTATIELEERT